MVNASKSGLVGTLDFLRDFSAQKHSTCDERSRPADGTDIHRGPRISELPCHEVSRVRNENDAVGPSFMLGF